METEMERMVRIGEIRNGRRPLVAAATGRCVGWVRWDSGPALLGPLSVDEIAARVGPGERIDHPDRPNRNRCAAGHYFDEILSGACPWCG